MKLSPDSRGTEVLSTKTREVLEAISATRAQFPSKEIHFWIKPNTDEVVTGSQVHSDLVELHWRTMGLAENQTHSMFDAIACGWTRVRITAEAAVIQGNSLRDARRVVDMLLDTSFALELSLTISIEQTHTTWRETLSKWVGWVDISKTQSYQLRGFEDAERFARGVTGFAELAPAR
jgi:hypothetical protein